MTILKKLSKLLVFIGETELQIEFARQNICKLHSFEPYAAFQRLDRDQKGFLVQKDLQRFMK